MGKAFYRLVKKLTGMIHLVFIEEKQVYHYFKYNDMSNSNQTSGYEVECTDVRKIANLSYLVNLRLKTRTAIANNNVCLINYAC